MRSTCVRQVPFHNATEAAVVRRVRAFVVWLGLAALATLSGCAVGNTYEYRLQSACRCRSRARLPWAWA